MAPTVRVLNPGDTTKPDPFTICIVANPALERRFGSGTFVPDPITANQPLFDASVARIVDTLFGRLPGQRENIFANPAMAAAVRIVSIFDPALPAEDKNSLAAEDHQSENMLIARRTVAQPFLTRHGFTADVSYAVSNSPTHTRASAFFTTDDDTAPGVPFRVDGRPLTHRFRCLVPGTIAIHVQMNTLTPLHEFQHAISSYSNGSIVDLYVDNVAALNNKRMRPRPASFGSYNTTALRTDLTRDGLGYPGSWRSFHCELHAPSLPAVMDNYNLASAPGTPEQCENDRITRTFVIDRMRAKMSR
jgi:hypothetical protein